jgi:predicted TIM-barrel fold metal-dependent hydrolase
MPRLPAAIVDFHVHLFPDKGFDAIWNYFKTYGAEVLYKYYTPECIDYLGRRGVARIVFSNYAHKAGVAEAMNAWNLALLARYPQLYCFAAYHPDDENALAQAARMLAHPRVAGIKLHCMVQRLWPHDERLFPLYELLMARRKRVLMHVGNGPMGNEFVGFAHFSKLLKRFPELPANVPHMGGLEFQAFIELLDDHPGIYLDTAYSFWPGLPFTFNLDKSYLEKYKHRILYGSDFPNVILPREGEVDTLLGLNLSEAFYRRVFCENAVELLEQICPEA